SECSRSEHATPVCRSAAFGRQRYSILSAYRLRQGLAAVRRQSGTSFCRRKILIFMFKFKAKETTGKYWVKYFRGAVKILLILRSFICCGMAKDCKPLPPIH